MKLHELSPAPGSTTPAWRKGRGTGSGNGKTAGKGHKGQNARSGGGVRPGFEGGQLPLYRKLPKRGFYNRFAKEYSVVNVEALNRFEDGAVVDLAVLADAGVISQPQGALKVRQRRACQKNHCESSSLFGECQGKDRSSRWKDRGGINVSDI